METWNRLHDLPEWRAAAPAAAAALRAGDPAPAVAMLDAWRFVRDQDWTTAFLDHLQAAELHPSGAAWHVAMQAPLDRTLATPIDWRDAVYAAASAPGAARGPGAPPDIPDVGDGLAWALVELATVGTLVDSIGRQTWADEHFASAPAADAELARLWRGWADGQIFHNRKAWEKATLDAAVGAFGAVLVGRRVPHERRQQALADARDGWFWTLLGGGEGSESWRELAVRVIESGGAGPVDALAAALRPDDWDRVAGCAVTRGHGPATARLAWGSTTDWLQRSRDLQRRGRADPTVLEELLDLHVACRLVTCWAEPPRMAPERSWTVVRNNRGRARARLRAVLREAPADWLVEQVLRVPALAARTRRAASRFGRDWAWQTLQYGLGFDDSRTLDPTCHHTDNSLPAYTTDERRQLLAWMLNVVLKARLRHLLAWVYKGGERDGVDLKDAAWGRLLSDEIPMPLRSAGPDASRSLGLARLRAELVELLPELAWRLLPTVEAVAQLTWRARRTAEPFAHAIAPALHPAVKPPKVQVRRYIQHARADLDLLASIAEDPQEAR